MDELEQKRIVDAGGQIYQTAAATPSSNASKGAKIEYIVGPYRVLPGRLSVSRTFGDVEAKSENYGGNPNVVIATPEIKSFKITKDHDFIAMGSDGIFDKLNNKDVVQCVWNGVANELAQNVHQQSGVGIETIIKNTLMRRSLDNVTAVIIAFSNFKKVVFGSKKAPETAPANTKPTVNEKQNDKSNITTVREKQEAVKRILPSSTKAATKQHFDFSKERLESLEAKRAIKK